MRLEKLPESLCFRFFYIFTNKENSRKATYKTIGNPGIARFLINPTMFWLALKSKKV